MSATINTFPAVHTFNSPRGWAMAIIALIHLGFFWVLASGMSKTFTIFPPPKTEVVFTPPPTPPEPTPHKIENVEIRDHVFVPLSALLPPPPVIDSSAPRDVTSDPPRVPPPTDVIEAVKQEPQEIGPEIDPRRGFSEPVYPSVSIREGSEGTVILSVQVLENGRVGEVRVQRSSGDRRLDESAAREAKRWRFIAGTRDGVPAVLWKEIPVTFRLQNVRR